MTETLAWQQASASIDSPAVYQTLLGQSEAVHQVQKAVAQRAQGVHHAWLFTGPPGSGRSNLALAFAAALLCPEQGCATCGICSRVLEHQHPDVKMLTTEKVIIGIDEIRDLVAGSHFGASMGDYRILIIEDADRMAERSSNVLLKALEEPPAGTIWLLCAPSEADLLPTIRSRVRRVSLKVPSVEDVAQLLVQRDGVDPHLARQAAAEAQSHVGMARRLATSLEARGRRRDTLVAALSISSVSSAMFTAERWLDLAKKDADAITAERDSQEKLELRRQVGLAEAESIPNAYRVEFKNLEEDQKRRSTRSIRDGIDRILVDLLALYRDVLTVQLQTQSSLVNEDLKMQIDELAAEISAAETIKRLEAIETARTRVLSNVKDLVALEALAVQLRRKTIR
jgi:DNA polymerase-3 subunit delta'